MRDYLVQINSGFTHVKGTIRDTQLHWRDPYDSETGIANKGDYIPQFPRQHSIKEKKVLWRR